jgi:putative membrane protein
VIAERATEEHVFFGEKPSRWIAFALVVLAIPVFGLIAESHLSFRVLLPTINASLNGVSALCLFVAWRAIRAGWVGLHWRAMTGALVASALFLVFYVIRFSMTGAHRYPVHDWTRTVYLVVLGTHTLLASTVPFLAGFTLRRALRKDFARHRRLARIALPIWGYVSVTGVVVYLMLYHLAPHRLGR